jgi:hypothetical protein
MGKGGATSRRVGLVIEPCRALGISTSRGLFEALAPLPCGACRRTIAAGERFTRRKRAGRGPRPVCRACAPFEEAG